MSSAVTIIAAVAAASIAGIASIISAVILRRVNQVHVLVNSRYTDISDRLDMAQNQIKDLKSERGIARGDPGRVD